MTTRVLYVDHADFRGGAQVSLEATLRAVDRSRHCPVLACPGDSPLAQVARTLDVPVAPIEFGRLKGTATPTNVIPRLAAGAARLAGIAREHDAGLIHSNAVRASIYAMLAAPLVGLPHVWHVRDLGVPAPARGALSAQAAAIVPVSRACLQSLPRWARRKAEVLHNGLDLRHWDPNLAAVRERAAELRRQWGVGPDDVLVGNCGWFARWKGQHLFVEVARQLRTTHPRCRFVAVGRAEGPDQRAYFEQVRRDGEGTVHFAGFFPDTRAVFAAFDVFVNCSNEEPFGRVLIEALAMGTPVVSHASGGPVEIVVDGHNGALVAQYSAEALASGTRTVLSHLQALRGNARRDAKARFDVTRVTQRLAEIYERVA